LVRRQPVEDDDGFLPTFRSGTTTTTATASRFGRRRSRFWAALGDFRLRRVVGFHLGNNFVILDRAVIDSFRGSRRRKVAESRLRRNRFDVLLLI
jgi:hypothetical protein